MSKKVFVPGQPGIIEASEFIKAAVPSYPNPVAHPLGPPTMSGTTYSVDLALQQPTRVTRTVMDLTLQRFFADRVFTNSGGVTGGAVVYDVVLTNDIYLERDIGRVAPGGEFPIVTSLRRAPQVAAVEKWGGKFFVTDEARDRNDVSVYTRHIRQLANTIVRKINQRAVEVLNAAVSGSDINVVSHDRESRMPPHSNGMTGGFPEVDDTVNVRAARGVNAHRPRWLRGTGRNYLAFERI